MNSLSLILPAYQEERRLPRTLRLLREARDQGAFLPLQLSEIWIVSDGSTDRTVSVSLETRSQLPEIRVHEVTPNQGKGNAIHEGLKRASGDWVLIADADGATPWDQFQKLYRACEEFQAPVSIGSRDLPESDLRQRESWIRENLGRLFNLAVQLVTGLRIKDTQCGFKLIKREACTSFFDRLQIKRFAWDVEFLIYAHRAGLKICEIPVAWEHQAESKISPLRDGIEMFLRVLQLRIRILFESKSE
jgi:glycosyltransferase involved in cell wall biosynthesis